jgi:hypothetical protein
LSTRTPETATSAIASVADAVSDSVYARYGISPGRFAGSDGGIYEHHLVADKAIDAAHAKELPRTMRFMMRRVGALEPNGARILSYLLVERGYCRHLMHLGFSDAMTQRNNILSVLGYASTGALERPPLLRAIPTN